MKAARMTRAAAKNELQLEDEENTALNEAEEAVVWMVKVPATAAVVPARLRTTGNFLGCLGMGMLTSRFHTLLRVTL